MDKAIAIAHLKEFAEATASDKARKCLSADDSHLAAYASAADEYERICLLQRIAYGRCTRDL